MQDPILGRSVFCGRNPPNALDEAQNPEEEKAGYGYNEHAQVKEMIERCDIVGRTNACALFAGTERDRMRRIRYGGRKMHEAKRH